MIGLVLAAVAIAGCSASPGSGPSTSGGPSGSASSPAPTGSGASQSPSESASSSPSSSTTPVPAGKTRIDFVVTGCEGCRIFAYQFGTHASPLASPTQVSGVVTGGKLSLLVPTKDTVGMVFLVGCSGDRCNSSNSQPVAVLSYQGQAVGSSVSDAVAAAAKQASACWAGTSAQTATLALTASFFADDIMGRSAHSVRIWASPQAPVVAGTWLPTYHGGLGTQSEVVCG